MTYRCTKTFGHDLGLSACFRQWRAGSHCAFLHGYALAVRLEFEAEVLDERQWVVDFGSFGPLKDWLRQTFDHKTLVASDDPQMPWLREAHARGVVDMVEVPATGCEAFARLVGEATQRWLREAGHAPRCRLVSAEVREHGANAAQWFAGAEIPAGG